MSLWDRAADVHTSKSEKKTDCYMSLWDHAADLQRRLLIIVCVCYIVEGGLHELQLLTSSL